MFRPLQGHPQAYFTRKMLQWINPLLKEILITIKLKIKIQLVKLFKMCLFFKLVWVMIEWVN
jgi:hypothetical protein